MKLPNELARKLALQATQSMYANSAKAFKAAPDKALEIAKSEAQTIGTNLFVTPISGAIKASQAAAKLTATTSLGAAVYRGATRELPEEETEKWIKNYTDIPEIGDTITDCFYCLGNAVETIITPDKDSAKQALQDSPYADRADRLGPLAANVALSSRGSKDENAQKISEFAAMISKHNLVTIPTTIFNATTETIEIGLKPLTSRVEDSIMQARVVGKKLKKIVSSEGDEQTTHEPRQYTRRRPTGQITR